MHEVSIVNDLFKVLMDVSEKEGLHRIDKVNFTIGKMMHIVPEFFEFAFDSAKENTIAAEASIEIEYLPIKMRCENCHAEFTVDNNTFVCPDCRSTNLTLIQGKELVIKSIEGE